jgi:hypothetical protein
MKKIMTSRPKHKKPFTKMTAAELAEATKRFDAEPLPMNAGVSLTDAEQAEWNRLKRGRGRPRRGNGAVNVLVSLERGLLERANTFAKSNGIGRSKLISIALESLMSRQKPVRALGHNAGALHHSVKSA